MDKFRNLILILAGVAVVAASYVVVTRPAEKPVGNPPLGALSSPDISSPYISWGGVRTWGAHTDNLAAGTTTVCALQSPAATSTMRLGVIRFNFASTTNNVVVDLAKGTTFNATTTILGSASLSSGVQATFVASSTANTLVDGQYVFAPNQWFVVGLKGGLGGVTGSAPSGACSAQWTEI